MRKNYGIREELEQYRYNNLIIGPYPIIFPNTDILVTDISSMNTIIKDILLAKRINHNCRIFIMGEKDKDNLISLIFPFVEFLDSKTSFKSVLNEKKNQKIESLRLSEREDVILKELQFGISQREIGEKIGLSERTMRRVINKLLLKTGLGSIKQLIAYSNTKEWVNIMEENEFRL